MKISKDSWHYEMVSFYLKESSPSDSLCIYFWQVVGLSIFTLVTFCVIAAVLFISIKVLVFIPVELTINGYLIIYAYWLSGFYLLQKILQELPEESTVGKTFRYTPWKNSVDKEPNIVLEYVRAKKQKICPKIDFV